ncbi:MAG TPA: Beta-galactosidase C-terminal domain, partial [Anaerolineales bacterium]|nr:Beta-galactosidase C-terminal domain [Anaerolineales bacterium]
DYYAGSPAVTRNRFGTGTAFYVGTVPDQRGMDWLLAQVCETAGVRPVLSNIPAGIELLQRTDGTASWLFLLNHSAERVTVPLQQHGSDLLTGANVSDSVELGPSGVAIIHIED